MNSYGLTSAGIHSITSKKVVFFSSRINDKIFLGSNLSLTAAFI
jgi:hypothetical protein